MTALDQSTCRRRAAVEQVEGAADVRYVRAAGQTTRAGNGVSG
jgi:hypothetical protein